MKLPEGLGSFVSGDLAFEVDDGYSLLQLASAEEVDDQTLDRRLAAGAPPDAPLASWLLARLARLAGGTLALEEETVEICEGALYVVDFVLRKDGEPIGKVQLQAGRAGAALLGVVSQIEPAEVIERFTTALLADPHQIAACRVRVRDPSWPEEEVVDYGFDGVAYL